MSQSDNTRMSDEEMQKYRSTAGAEIKTADVASDGHALKQVLGTDDGDKERVYDAKIAGERFVQFYDDSAAAIREYLSNAETACIRRAKAELRDAGVSDDDIPSNISDLLTLAKEKTGYEPLIEVTYNRKSDENRLIIEDNGIGISVEEYQVVQRIGYSTSHGDGERLGQFGMGWMSGFQLTSIHGWFQMSTKSYLTDEAYSTQEFVGNCEYLDYQPDDYGTRFEFPSFGEAGKEINIPEKVSEFADGMRVPLIYRDFDASGSETGRSDDFLPRNIEDDYKDDSLVVAFENEFFKAVMSPSSPEGRRSDDLITYNVTMPIRRNLDSWQDFDSFEAPWKWDFRGKREDAPVVKCESDDSLVGKVPVENSKYDNMSKAQQDRHIPMSNVPDDAIVMPGPASSRDSYMSGHDEFWSYVSECLNDAWGEIAKERFEVLNTWDDFMSMSREEKEGLFRAYRQFGPSYSENDPDNIQETLEEALGVTVPTDVCEKLDKSRSTLYVVPRGHNQAHRKTPAKSNKKKIWQLIDEAPDGVYMGRSISQKKAELAWDLGETHVVLTSPDDGQSTKERYEELEELWSFKKLKDLPSSKLKQKLPELSDDVADKWENADQVNNTSSSSGTRTSRDPTTKRIKVRVGKGSRSKFRSHRVDNLEDKLSKDDSFRAGRYDCKRLLIYDQTKISGSTSPIRHASSSDGIAVAAVPKYVFNYLKDIDNVYTDKKEIAKEEREKTLDEFDTADRVYFTSGDIYREYTDSVDDLTEILNTHCDADLDESASVELFKEDSIKGASYVDSTDFDADLVFVNASSYKTSDIRRDAAEYSINMVDIAFQQKVPEMDQDAPEFYQVFGKKRYLTVGSDKFNRGIEMVQSMGGTFPSQQDN